MGIILIRAIILVLMTAAGYFYPPFHLSRLTGAVAGLVLGILIIWLENRLRRVQFRLLWTGSIGLLLGVLIGWLVGSIYQSVFKATETSAFIRLFFLIAFPYIGFVLGIKKPEWLEPSFLAHFFEMRDRTAYL